MAAMVPHPRPNSVTTRHKTMAKKNKKNWSNSAQEQPEREDSIELQGMIDEALPGTLFRVICDNGIKVLCTLSGKLRLHHIRLLPGDRVTIEVSPYDLTRGRVAWRSK
jgi:translation initiation factor IF-1